MAGQEQEISVGKLSYLLQGTMSDRVGGWVGGWEKNRTVLETQKRIMQVHQPHM